MELYAIWKDVDDRNVNGVKDLVGYFQGTYEDADALVAKMNAEDTTVRGSLFGGIRFGFWKQEITRLTIKNYGEFIAS